MPIVHFILNDEDLKGFYELCTHVKDFNSFKDEENYQSTVSNYFKYEKVQKKDNDRCKHLLFINCSFKRDVIKSVGDARVFIENIKEQNKEYRDIFLHIKEITPDQFSALVRKGGGSSCAFFYNFGKTYIANKTFFDSGYSLFGENIAHEAINCFMTDQGERYFYLCDDGKICNYNNPNCTEYERFPNNYINWNKAELINFSKYDSAENNTNTYAILQRVTKIEPCETAFQAIRNNDNYKEITYGNINICDIFSSNDFVRRNPRTGDETHADENYPFVTFKASKDNVFVPSGQIPVFCPNNDNRFRNFSSSSLKQYSIFEGTELYNAFEEIIGNDNNWKKEDPLKVLEYIKTDNYRNDIEEDFLLKIIDRDRKETFFSRIIEYLFANSSNLLSRFFENVFKYKIIINSVTGVYNEEKNMDIMLTFKDEDEKMHIVVIENKLFAPFNDNQIRGWDTFFRNDANVEIVRNIYNYYIKNTPNKTDNQLTKYYNIASVLYLNMTGKKDIDNSKMHFLILAPEFRVSELKDNKENYNYGERYEVVSYKTFKDVLDKAILGGIFDTNEPLRDIALQFSRAIRQYASDNCTYYQRKMISRFAKAVEQKQKESSVI